VLGVIIVFIVSGMFILGLENSKIFSVLMITGVLSISGLFSVVTYLRGNTETWIHDNLFPKGLPGVRLMTRNYVSLSLTNDVSFVTLVSPDFISLGAVSYFISQQFAGGWRTLSEN
jgi:hypothetical protein